MAQFVTLFVAPDSTYSALTWHFGAMPRRGTNPLTVERVEAMQRKAVRFAADVLRDDDKADELESLTPEEYAERKGIRIVGNPKPDQQGKRMMAAKSPTKQDLEELLDEAGAKAQQMLDAKLTRRELVELAEEMDELLNGPADEDEDEEAEDELDDEDDD
jgi:hypothetical protein